MGQTRRSDAHVSVICYISAYHINYVPSLVSVSSCESIYILFPYFSSLTPLLFSFPMSCMKIVKTCSSLSGTELRIRFSNAFSFLLALFLSLSSLFFSFFFCNSIPVTISREYIGKRHRCRRCDCSKLIRENERERERDDCELGNRSSW